MKRFWSKTLPNSISVLLLVSVLGYLAFVPNVAVASCGNGYAYCRTITIDHTKVGSGTEDETQFPWLASSTISSLATVGNGGHIQNTTTESGSSYTGTVPADLIFTSDSGCTTDLNWEIESYNSATGNIIAWISNSSTALSHSADTVVYMCYGNSSVTTWQGNVHGVWDSHFVGVWHFPNGSSLNLNDSTSNGWNLSNVNSVTATSTLIDGGANYGGVAQSLQNTSLNFNSSPVTYSVWAYKSSANSGSETSLGGASTFSDPNRFALDLYSDSNVYWDYGNFIGGSGRVSAGYSGHFDAWTLVDATSGGGTGGQALYFNGSSVASAGTSDTVSGSTGFNVGNEFAQWKDQLDEARLSNISRSAGWISTEYNTESAPDKANYGSSGFYTVGAEQQAPAGPVQPQVQMLDNKSKIIINKGQTLIY